MFKQYLEEKKRVLTIFQGVDALNTTLEVLLFAACMRLGQSWKTVATLFACEMIISKRIAADA